MLLSRRCLDLLGDELSELGVGLVEVVVDNDLVVGALLLRVGELGLSGSQTLLQRLGGLGATSLESLSEVLDRGRSNKKESGVKIGLLDRLDALHVNVENTSLLLEIRDLADSGDGGAVVVARELGPFNESVLGNDVLELVDGDKVVVLAVDLAGSGASGGVCSG